MIVPRKCTAIMSKLSIKPYGDYGFSPDILITKIPFPVKTKNESFELKSELFDINSNLIYSDLRSVNTFDTYGESLYLYIPGLKDPSNTNMLRGSLEIKGGLSVNDNVLFYDNLTTNASVYFKGLEECGFENKRFLAWNPPTNLLNPLDPTDETGGKICYTDLNDISYVDKDIVNIQFASRLSDGLSSFRLISSVEGRNVYVPPAPPPPVVPP